MVAHRGIRLYALLVVFFAAGSSSNAPISELAPGVVREFRALMNKSEALEQAEHRLIGECMRRSHLPYPDSPEYHAVAPVAGLLRLPARLSPDSARRNGYPDALMATTRRPAETAVDRLARSLPEATRERFYLTLRGSDSDVVRVRLINDVEVRAPSTGCVAVAREQLYGSTANHLTVFYVPELAQRYIDQAAGAPEMRIAFHGYSECMAARRYRVTTPSEAVDLAKSYYLNGARDIANNAEIALATADAECRLEVRLHETYQAAADRVATQWISRNHTTVTRAYRLMKSAVNTAHDLMAR